MIVLHSISSIHKRNGGPTYSLNGIIELTKKSISHKIICIEDGDIISKDIKRFHFTIPNYFILINEIKNCNLVHIHGLWNFNQIFIWIFSFLYKKKIYVSPRGSLDEWSLNQSFFKKKVGLVLYQKFLILKSNLIICSSEYEKKMIQKIIKTNKIYVIPNYINIPNNNSVFLNNIESYKRFVYISRIHPKKGFQLLLEAIMLIPINLLKSYYFEFYGIGEVNYINELKNKIKILKNMGYNINYMGIINEEKYEVLKSSYFLILPSYTENFGNIILESLSMGCPVIVSKNTCWVNDIENYGILTDTSVEGIKDSILSAIKIEKKDWYLLSNNAKKYYQINFSKEVLYHKYFNLYNN